MAKPKLKVRYAVVDLTSSRKGALVFLDHNQSYWSKSLKKTKKEAKSFEDDYWHNTKIVRLIIEEVNDTTTQVG